MTKKVKDMSPEEHKKYLEYARRSRMKRRSNRPMPARWVKKGDELFESYNRVFPNE